MTKLVAMIDQYRFAELLKIRDMMKDAGNTNPQDWRDLGKNFFRIGADVNADYCYKRAEYYERERVSA